MHCQDSRTEWTWPRSGTRVERMTPRFLTWSADVDVWVDGGASLLGKAQEKNRSGRKRRMISALK